MRVSHASRSVLRLLWRSSIERHRDRAIVGQTVGQIGREEVYRDLLAFNLLDAGYDVSIEHRLPFGYADVKAHDRLIEVEFLRTWRHGVRQALGYAWQEEDAIPAIAIIGRLLPDQAVAIHASTTDFLDLLLLEGCQWHTVRSAGEARHEWIPASPDAVVDYLADRNPDQLVPAGGFHLPRTGAWYSSRSVRSPIGAPTE